ncbi:MAG: hypothetical protein RIS35_3340 [Pseudomonadota bacterium]
MGDPAGDSNRDRERGSRDPREGGPAAPPDGRGTPRATDSGGALIRALLDSGRDAGLARPVDLIETHISWVLLAGEHAYKIKKPLSLGFLDFASLEARRHFCEEEVRLNRRLAPELYLGVVPITGSPDAPVVGGTGRAIEYAVRMKRFRTGDELDRRIDRDPPDARSFIRFAARIAAFHAAAPRAAPGSGWGSPEEILAHSLDNFALIDDTGSGSAPDLDAEPLAELRTWTQHTFDRLRSVFSRRRERGFVRECHGDLHLANLVCVGEDIVAFDAIEFNPGLRWIDVISEVAFTVMDLNRHRRPDLAQRFLDGWLAASGDYAGLRLLPFYLVYRAMVRAKVGSIRWSQSETDAERDALARELRELVAVARGSIRPRTCCLVITHGVSGSGKSHLADGLIAAGDWIRIRSDVERKRLAGLPPDARRAGSPETGLYGPASTEATYARLAQLARVVLDAGYPVLVDATFLGKAQRNAFRSLAGSLGVPFGIVGTEAAPEVMERRIRARAARGEDPSDATVPVLHAQLASIEALDDAELDCSVIVDTSVEADAAAVSARIRRVARVPDHKGPD